MRHLTQSVHWNENNYDKIIYHLKSINDIRTKVALSARNRKLRVDEANKNASQPIVSKFYLDNGRYGYHLWAVDLEVAGGALEARSSQLCGKKGYKKHLDERFAPNRRWIIQCNE